MSEAFQVQVPVFVPSLEGLQQQQAILRRLLARPVHMPAERAAAYRALLQCCQEALARPELSAADRLFWQREWGQGQIDLQVHLQDWARQSPPAEAILLLQECLRYGPPPPDMYVQLGRCFEQLDDTDAALDYFQQALARHPEDHEAYRCLGDLYYFRLNQPDEALQAYEHCARLGPPNVNLYDVMGNLYYYSGIQPQALDMLERAAELDPGNHTVLNNVLFVARMDRRCPPEAFLELASRHVQRFRRARQWEQPARYLHPPVQTGRPLRIGYLSPHFCNHAVAAFLYPILKHHNPHAFQTFCYASRRIDDAMSRNFRATSTTFRDVADLEEREVADLIFQDQVDILIDLTGYESLQSKLFSLIYKPARIQASYMGFFQTYALPEVDYVLTHPELVPPEEAHFYLEKPFYLEQFCAYLPGPANCAEIRGLPMLHKQHPTLGVFNHPGKCSHENLVLWGRILQALPTARLLFCRGNVNPKRIRERCAAAGIPVERVDFSPFEFQHYNEVDFCLDTDRFNAVTTAFDALLMGVPYLTLSSPGLPGRFGAYFNQRLGLADWIAQDADDYVAKAVAFAQQPERLREIRIQGRARLLNSPFFDHAAFVRQLEAGYVKMWRRYLKQNGVA
ncbi:MAG: tetratricopeptide repeat protein [Candidatus Sericytochromatia bacterium]